MLCNAKCNSSASLNGHFVSEHVNAVPEAQRKIMVKAGEQTVIRFDDITCLICDKWHPQKGGDAKASSRKFQSHMEKHMQEIAREALPLAIDGLDIRDAQSSGDDDDNDEEEGGSRESAPHEATSGDPDEGTASAVITPKPLSNDWISMQIGVCASPTTASKPHVDTSLNLIWWCLGPGADGITSCGSEHRNEVLLASHYNEMHAECSKPFTVFECLACGEEKQDKFCETCWDKNPLFDSKLYGSVLLDEPQIAFFQKMADKGINARKEILGNIFPTLRGDDGELVETTTPGVSDGGRERFSSGETDDFGTTLQERMEQIMGGREETIGEQSLDMLEELPQRRLSSRQTTSTKSTSASEGSLDDRPQS